MVVLGDDDDDEDDEDDDDDDVFLWCFSSCIVQSCTRESSAQRFAVWVVYVLLLVTSFADNV